MSLTLYLIAGYLLLLPLIGLWAFRQSKGENLKDYFLAGGSVGTIALVFTLYATQYSGNTLFGFAGNAYRNGLVALFSVAGMSAVIVFFALYARKIYALAKTEKFITLTDYLKHRYQHEGLAQLVNLVLVIGLFMYILTNFKAIGLLVEQLTNGQIPLLQAVMLMAVFMAIYESLGGMRGVILTDMIQGSLLFIGITSIFLITVHYFDGLPQLISAITTQSSSSGQHFSAADWRKGISLILMFGLAISIYPHAVQRVFAAKSWPSLRNSMAVMFFLPLITTLPIILISLAARQTLPEIEAAQTDQIVPLYLAQLSAHYPYINWLVALFMAAGMAAIMSTIDSALLSANAAITQDVLHARRPDLTERQLTIIGRVLTWVLLLSSAYFAANLPQNIWSLMMVKIEIMAQAMPALMLGLYLPRLRATPVLAGLIIGLAVTLVLKFGDTGLPLYNLHAGLWGVGANLVTLTLVSGLTRQKPACA